MLNLVPIIFGYKISTLDLKLIYTESGDVKIQVEAKSSQDSTRYRKIEIVFAFVAEARCISLPFYESNYTLIERQLEPLTGFYEVADSQYLQERISIYDPKNRDGYHHYIIAGNDGYVELIARPQYSVAENPAANDNPDVEVDFEFTGMRKHPVQIGYQPVHMVKAGYLATGVHYYYCVAQLAADGKGAGTIKFIKPEAYPNCLWIGKKISIQEGSRIVGYATIRKIFNPVLADNTKQG